MRFRIQAGGRDRDWRSAGRAGATRFTRPRPGGRTRLRVVATNNSGVWNETGASLEFSVAAA